MQANTAKNHRQLIASVNAASNLKIDKSFVADVHRAPQNSLIIIIIIKPIKLTLANFKFLFFERNVIKVLNAL